MDIKFFSPSKKKLERTDRDYFTIEIDGKKYFKVFDGEPEDNNLNRNFADVLNLPAILQMICTAVKEREVFNFEEIYED